MFRRIAPSLLIACVVSGACARPAGEGASAAPMAGKRVESRSGMVVASHPDAAAAGAEILRAGGNAMDAFAATAFALSVTDVSQTGLGGGGALTYYDARQKRADHLSFYPRTGGDAAWGMADTSGGACAGQGGGGSGSGGRRSGSSPALGQTQQGSGNGTGHSSGAQRVRCFATAGTLHSFIAEEDYR